MLFQARIQDERRQLLCEYFSILNLQQLWTGPSPSLSPWPRANSFDLSSASSLLSPLSQIYTGGAALTDAAYAKACPNGAPAALASPAYKRKRSIVEPSPFVGGKVCPIGEQACPLSSNNAFECLNVQVNLA